MKLTNIFIYPIKSCQGISLEKAQITPKGLTDYQQPQIYDRQFMLVDTQGKFITQRQVPQMAQIQVAVHNNNLYLSMENQSIMPLELTSEYHQKEMKVTVWRDQTIAIDQGDEVASWFQSALKLDFECRLVKQSDNHIRPINPLYSTAKNQPVSFADGYPFLLTNSASLDDLNQRLAHKYSSPKILVKMINFRPNLVVETDLPFAEDQWKKIKIGEGEFRVVKPCSRCIITTTDQQTGIRNIEKEPLLTLSHYRSTLNGIMFGQNMIPLHDFQIKVNDILRVLS